VPGKNVLQYYWGALEPCNLYFNTNTFEILFLPTILLQYNTMPIHCPPILFYRVVKQYIGAKKYCNIYCNMPNNKYIDIVVKKIILQYIFIG
jgi:hypothetical protein